MNIAILGCESSHAEEFAKRIHEKEIGKVTHVWDENHTLAKSKQDIICAEHCFEEIEKNIQGIDLALIEGRYADSHFLPAKKALNKGIPVYIDKPAIATFNEAQELAEIADIKQLPLRSFTAMAMSSEFQDFSSKVKGFRHFVIGCPALCHCIDHKKANDLSFYTSHATDLLSLLVASKPVKVSCKVAGNVIWVTVEYEDDYLGTLYLPLKSEEFYFVQAMNEEQVVCENINPFGDMYDNMVEYICKTIPEEGWYKGQFDNAIHSMWIIEQIKNQVTL